MDRPRLYTKKDVALALHTSGGVIIGDSPTAFPMANTEARTGVKWDVERILEFPDHKRMIAELYARHVRRVNMQNGYHTDRLFGVPDGMTAMASSVADLTETGIIPLKKPPHKSWLISDYQFRTDYPHTAIGLEDVITTGESTRRAAYTVNKSEYTITDIIALISRNNPGKELLGARTNARVHALFSSVELAEVLMAEGKMDGQHLDWVRTDYDKVY